MVDWIIQRPRSVLVIFAVLIGVLGSGIAGLKIDPNNRAFFSDNHVHYSELLSLEALFGPNTNLLYVLVSEDGLYASTDLPRATRWLTRAAAQIEGVRSVDSLASFPYATSKDDQIDVSNLLDYLCPDPAPCLKVRSDAVEKPHIIGRYVDKDAKSVAVIAKVDLFEPDSDEIARIADEARSVQHEVSEKFPGLKVYLTGGVPMMYAFMDAARRDSSSLILLALVVFAVGLYVFLGSLYACIAMLVTAAASVVVALGLAGWAGHVLNTATATAPLIIITLVIASSMHVFVYIVREDNVGDQATVKRVVLTAVNSNLRPLILTTGTTAAGFLSMLFVSAPPLRELGVIATVGISTGAILTVTIVPALFALRSRLRIAPALRFLQEAINRFARHVERVRPGLSWGLLLFAVSAVGIMAVEIEEDFVRYFPVDSEFRAQTQEITSRLAGPYHLDIVYDAQEPSGVLNPTAVEELFQLSRFVREHSSVVNVLSVVDVLQEAASGFGLSSSLAGMSQEELAELFLSYELSLGQGQSTQDLMDQEYRRARVSILLGDVSMGDIRRIGRDIEEWATREISFGKVRVTGEGMPTAYLSSESISEMGWGIFFGVVVSALLVGWFFGRLGIALIILAAIALPILAGFGLWGLIGSEIGMAAVLVVATTIGIVIDDTIHLAYRYVDGLRAFELSVSSAAGYSIHKTGLALVITSLVLASGLSLLAFSGFRMNSTFGVCASLIVILALIFNLSISPRLLKLVRD